MVYAPRARQSGCSAATDRGDPSPRRPPEALLQMRLQRLHFLALALQAVVVREVELELDDRDEAHLLELALPLPRLKDLEHVAFLHVLVAVEHEAALEAGGHLACVLLEASQRADPAGPDHGALAHEPHVPAAADHAVGHVRAGDRADA